MEPLRFPARSPSFQYLIRDHDAESFEQRKRMLEQAAMAAHTGKSLAINQASRPHAADN